MKNFAQVELFKHDNNSNNETRSDYE
jgi:hypothetical protein